ncbi:MAG TPA: YihY/virulence factor BrkB family protein [Chitinophagaceae bacterium]|nr:YihY/virulence factor BrkB family protein [Chitinophagaceae bacterium]
MKKIERIIVTLPLISFIIRQSKLISLPGFEGVPLFDVIKFFFRQVRQVGLNERASAIAYNFIMAIPPACLFLFTVIPHLPFINKKTIKEQLHTLILDVIPAKVHNQNIIKFIDSFLDQSRFGLLSFGLILSLFFASNAMMGLMRSFNKNYIGFEKRTNLHQRWMAIKLISLIFGLVLGCLILLISQGAFLKWIGIRDMRLLSFIKFFRWIFIVGLIFYSIAFIYKYAPATQKKWRLVSPGSLLATTLSISATLGFSLFVNNFGRFNALFGSIGTVIMLMILIFINSLSLLIGFELNVSIKSLKAISDERQKTDTDGKPVLKR